MPLQQIGNTSFPTCALSLLPPPPSLHTPLMTWTAPTYVKMRVCAGIHGAGDPTRGSSMLGMCSARISPPGPKPFSNTYLICWFLEAFFDFSHWKISYILLLSQHFYIIIAIILVYESLIGQDLSVTKDKVNKTLVLLTYLIQIWYHSAFWLQYFQHEVGEMAQQPRLLAVPQVQFQACTWQCTIVFKSNPRRSNTHFWPS